jgi:hypothetical protein
MSKAYTSDGKRRSSQTHARRAHKCVCGRVVYGNGGWASHTRACAEYKARYGCWKCGSIRRFFSVELDDWCCENCRTWGREQAQSAPTKTPPN